MAIFPCAVQYILGAFFILCINYCVSLYPTPLLLLPFFSLLTGNHQFVLYVRDSVSVLLIK